MGYIFIEYVLTLWSVVTFSHNGQFCDQVKRTVKVLFMDLYCIYWNCCESVNMLYVDTIIWNN